ncbi:acyltransferase [Desulfolutivibrio sulfoxidireducens]|uniref:acyltransferase n=1 Tax=Desulfolutivibrio sulfoxidireducens TaxID=2773299 RepID=UPI00159E3B0B|nr:acyltransferase [Desulfolutivibrio sulfoxidireducens]QLA18215.1 acyltransferase [Desulfolutivibrio sulfoxidireducens]
MLHVAPSARISPLADIEDSVRGSCIRIGDQVVLDSFVKIKPAGGLGDLIIGSRSVINSGTVIYTGHGVRIGSDVAIAANCTLAATNHEYRSKNLLIREQGFMDSRGGIVIEDDVWIGANCVILDGAVLRQGCIIGAGSLVRGEVEGYALHAGNPLKLVTRRT